VRSGVSRISVFFAALLMDVNWPAYNSVKISQLSNVLNGCATINVARPCIDGSIASMIEDSVFRSIELVGLSRFKIGTCFRNACGTAIRWRSLPDKCGPRFPNISKITFRLRGLWCLRLICVSLLKDRISRTKN
jgi:hypothetical protein